jgi:amino acid transporter
MIGELAAAVPEEGGFYAWVRRAMGPFWGFQEAWLSLAASIFDMAIYPTLFVTYLGHLQGLGAVLQVGHRELWIELAVVIVATLWNLRGAVAVGHSSVVMWFVGLSPFFVLLGAAFWRGLHTGSATLAPPHGHPDLAAGILVALWNYMGWDNASTIAGEVEEPQRTYPKVMITCRADNNGYLPFAGYRRLVCRNCAGAILHRRMGGRSAEPGRLSFGARSYPGRRAR